MYRQLEIKSESGLHYFPRVMLYALPALALSFLINITKFLEWEMIQDTFIDQDNQTHHLVFLNPSSLAKDLNYITYYKHWTR